MLKNYLKISLRNLSRHKIYTFINIAGLSLGMACALLLYLYIKDELSFDRYHDKSDRIYRVSTWFKLGNKAPRYFASSSERLAPVLPKEFPTQVAQSVRLFRGTEKKPVRYKDKKAYLSGIHYADSNYFKVFSHKLIKGDPDSVLVKPNSIVLTKTVAKQFFGRAGNAIGKVIKVFDNQSNTVTGVMEDLPKNSHLRFPALVSYATIYKPQNMNDWGSANFLTYVLLKPEVKIENFRKSIQNIFTKYIETEFKPFNAKAGFRVDPLVDLHLSEFEYEDDDSIKGNHAYLYILAAVAVFMLLIAAINYMNLATARSAGRAKEVGIRKVVGSYRSQLILQFLLESVLLTLISLVISVTLVELSLPYFNYVSGKDLVVQYSDPSVFGLLVLIMLLVGLVSGSYPAFFLSSFNPVRVLKGKYVSSRNAAFMRRGLVIFQFTISITMIIGTWIVYNQLQFIRNKDLGFNKEQVVVVRTFGDTTNLERNVKVRDELLNYKNIKGVAFMSNVPGQDGGSNTDAFKIENTQGEMKITLVHATAVAYDYLDLMGIELKKGRFYSKKIASDTSKAVVVNEAFVRKMGWKTALGKKVYLRTDSVGNLTKGYGAKVVGVVKDFHLTSLHKKIQPLLLRLVSPRSQGHMGYLLARLAPENRKQTLDFIKNTWYKYEKKYAYESYFLDKKFNKQYHTDEIRGQIFMAFSGLTIFIACLGLLGLASFTAEQRVKEIGIRKVLGASIPSILRLMSFDFLRLVVWASLFGSVLGAWMMHTWLQNFAYYLPLYQHWFVFILSVLLALFIALLTVSVQVLKVSQVNPIEVLKDE